MIYTLQLSTKETIQITEEEKLKFENNLDKNFIKIGAAIINPSFVVSITVDREATRQNNLYGPTPTLIDTREETKRLT